jgi:hypothetical protein
MQQLRAQDHCCKLVLQGPALFRHNVSELPLSPVAVTANSKSGAAGMSLLAAVRFMPVTRQEPLATNSFASFAEHSARITLNNTYVLQS